MQLLPIGKADKIIDMMQNNLRQWIQHPELLDSRSLNELSCLIERYPYFQTARILYLKNLFILGQPSFKDQLARNAVYISDLRVLFHYIEAERLALSDHAGALKSTSDQRQDRTLDLIDRFLSELPEDGQTSNLLPLCESNTDYAVMLLGGDAETDAAPPLKGQNLIDDFLKKTALHAEEGWCKPVGRTCIDSAEIVCNDDTGYDSPIKTEEIHSNEVVENMSVSAIPPAQVDADEGYFTETLARIYVKQQRYDKALEIIKKLYLKYPKKNAYFADQIRFLEKLIINTKSK